MASYRYNPDEHNLETLDYAEQRYQDEQQNFDRKNAEMLQPFEEMRAEAKAADDRMMEQALRESLEEILSYSSPRDEEWDTYNMGGYH